MIVHLQGRENGLEPFGWTGRQAEWIALACLHSGVFTRSQWSRFLDAHPEQTRRGIHALIAQGVASEETVPRIGGIGRVCRIFHRRIYRALGAEDIRHRRTASPEVLLRRLLSLDYVLEHPDLGWLPTEPEKILAFESLGIDRRHFPLRIYRGAAGETRRYFPLKLPIALAPERALFVYADPGHDTDTALRSWGAAHRSLWEALAERGRQVEVVAVARTWTELERARTVLKNWAEGSGDCISDAEARREIARIEQAILQGTVRILDEFGGLQAALKRCIALKKQPRRHPNRGLIHCGGTWQSTRLAEAHFV